MRRAFTLIEMLVVLAIIIMVTAIALPALKHSLEASKVTEASRQVNTMFAKARTRAAATGRPCGLLVEQSQLTLMEVPPRYSGDTIDAKAAVGAGNQLQFTPPGSYGMLTSLVADSATFDIRFDYKGPTFRGQRFGTNFFVISGPTAPPAVAMSYEITRDPVRVGEAMSLPRGTCIDLNYSGFSNTGIEFSGTTPIVMFSQDGHVQSGGLGLMHFLVGMPEKVIALPFAPDSNIVDSESVWVSVSNLTGSVVSTSNTVNVSLPRSTPAEKATFLFDARTFARERDNR